MSLRGPIHLVLLTVLCIGTRLIAGDSNSLSFFVVPKEDGTWRLQMEKTGASCWFCACLPAEIRNSTPRCQIFATAFDAVIHGLEVQQMGEEVDALIYLQRPESTRIRFSGLRQLFFRNPRINLHTLLFGDGLSALRKSYGEGVPISEMSFVVRKTNGQIPLALTLPGQELTDDPTDDVSPTSLVGKSDARFELNVPLNYLQQHAGKIAELNRQANPFISKTSFEPPSSESEQPIVYVMGPSFIKIPIPVIQTTRIEDNTLHLTLRNADSVAAIPLINFPGLHAGCFRIELQFTAKSTGRSEVAMNLHHPIDQYHETLLAKITETLAARFRQIEQRHPNAL